jgi:hypothetical protein
MKAVEEEWKEEVKGLENSLKEFSQAWEDRKQTKAISLTLTMAHVRATAIVFVPRGRVTRWQPIDIVHSVCTLLGAECPSTQTQVAV